MLFGIKLSQTLGAFVIGIRALDDAKTIALLVVSLLQIRATPAPVMAATLPVKLFIAVTSGGMQA